MEVEDKENWFAGREMMTKDGQRNIDVQCLCSAGAPVSSEASEACVLHPIKSPLMRENGEALLEREDAARPESDVNSGSSPRFLGQTLELCNIDPEHVDNSCSSIPGVDDIKFIDDEDDEVFFGAQTAREKRKAAKYRRRTVLYKPGFRRDRRLMRYTMLPTELGMLQEEEEDAVNGEEEGQVKVTDISAEDTNECDSLAARMKKPLVNGDCSPELTSRNKHSSEPVNGLVANLNDIGLKTKMESCNSVDPFADRVYDCHRDEEDYDDLDPVFDDMENFGNVPDGMSLDMLTNGTVAAISDDLLANGGPCPGSDDLGTKTNSSTPKQMNAKNGAWGGFIDLDGELSFTCENTQFTKCRSDVDKPISVAPADSCDVEIMSNDSSSQDDQEVPSPEDVLNLNGNLNSTELSDMSTSEDGPDQKIGNDGLDNSHVAGYIDKVVEESVRIYLEEQSLIKEIKDLNGVVSGVSNSLESSGSDVNGDVCPITKDCVTWAVLRKQRELKKMKDASEKLSDSSLDLFDDVDDDLNPIIDETCKKPDDSVLLSWLSLENLSLNDSHHQSLLRVPSPEPSDTTDPALDSAYHQSPDKSGQISENLVNASMSQSGSSSIRARHKHPVNSGEDDVQSSASSGSWNCVSESVSSGASGPMSSISSGGSVASVSRTSSEQSVAGSSSAQSDQSAAGLDIITSSHQSPSAKLRPHSSSETSVSGSSPMLTSTESCVSVSEGSEDQDWMVQSICEMSAQNEANEAASCDDKTVTNVSSASTPAKTSVCSTPKHTRPSELPGLSVERPKSAHPKLTTPELFKFTSPSVVFKETNFSPTLIFKVDNPEPLRVKSSSIQSFLEYEAACENSPCSSVQGSVEDLQDFNRHVYADNKALNRSMEIVDVGALERSQLNLDSISEELIETNADICTCQAEQKLCLLHSAAARVYREGTPRFAALDRIRSPVDMETSPPKLNWDDASSTSGSTRSSLSETPSQLDDDPTDEVDGAHTNVLSMEDVLARKKAQLQLLRQEKHKLQQKISCKASPLARKRMQSPSTPSRQLPRVRYKEKASPKPTGELGERELNAVTHLHTMCNAQRVVKFINKPRKATGPRPLTIVAKSASRLKWSDTLAIDLEASPPTPPSPEVARSRRRSILKQSGRVFPYQKESPSMVVITKVRRRSTTIQKARIT